MFYRALLERLTIGGAVRVIFARHDGQDIGFIFGGVVGGIYRGQQFSFDESWARFSIGNLLQFEQVKWLSEDGARRYDLGPRLGPGMAYKAHWTETLHTLETWGMQLHL